MNRTANYNLCQFEAGDQVQRTDFNEDNAKIDAAIAAEASARQSGDSSLSSRITTLNSTVSGKASQSALNTVKNQVAKLGNCQIHCFTYTGTGSSGTNGPTRVNFPRRPMFYFISGDLGLALGTAQENRIRIFYEKSIAPAVATWTGNQLSFLANDPGYQLNKKDMIYYVIALYPQDA